MLQLTYAFARQVNFGVNNPGSHGTPSSQEQPQHTDVYKATVEADDAQTQMEDLGKFRNNPSPDYEDEGSRQYSEEKEEVEYKDQNSQDEHTYTQPNDNSEVEHHQQKVKLTRLCQGKFFFLSMVWRYFTMLLETTMAKRFILPFFSLHSYLGRTIKLFPATSNYMEILHQLINIAMCFWSH